MLGFKQIELSDKEILDRFFHANDNQNSETTFTNLYMWRQCYAVRWVVAHGHLVISPNAFENHWILPPYGLHDDDDEFRQSLLDVREDFVERHKPFVIRAVTEEEKDRIERVLPGRFTFTYERDISDYVYLGENLRDLKGRKYSKKRNHLNAFLRDYPDHTTEALTAENVSEALDFVERWCGERNCTGDLDSSLLCERQAIHDALYAFDDLDFQGMLLRIDGKVVAFTMGEMINHDTLVVHIEKAFPQYRGLYPAINKAFANAFPEATYINREEDMGLEGLRKAKESYYPAYLLDKYKAVWEDEA